MHTILVTGASGFVGRHLLPELRATFPDARLVAASRAPVQGWDETRAIDLADEDSICAAVASVEPSAVVHLAAWSDTGSSFANARRVWSANVDGTMALSCAIMDVVPSCTLLLASSAEVYGLTFRAGVPLTEDAPFAPANPYGAAKAAADLAVGEMALRGLRAIRMRAFTHVGAGQSARFVLAAFAKQIAAIEAGEQEAVIRVGSLDRWRDLLDVRDVCRGYAEALRRAPAIAPGTAINLATGIPRHIGRTIDEMLEISGVQASIETDPARIRPTDLERTEGSYSRAAQLLNWSPSTPWRETLTSILTDWRDRSRSRAIAA